MFVMTLLTMFPQPSPREDHQSFSRGTEKSSVHLHDARGNCHNLNCIPIIIGYKIKSDFISFDDHFITTGLVLKAVVLLYSMFLINNVTAEGFRFFQNLTSLKVTFVNYNH